MSAAAAEPTKTTEQLAEDAAKAQADADAAKAAEAEGLKPVGAPAMDFIARALNQTVKPKKEKKPAEAEPGEHEDEDEDDDELRELEKPARSPEKKPVKAAPRKPAAAPAPPPAPAFDEEKLGAAVGRAVAAATKPKEPEKPALDPAVDKRRLAVMYQMEAQFGDKYKGLGERYVTNLAKHKEYKAKWEADHPGEEYDEDDEEHAPFLENLEAQVAYDDEDYNEALTDLKVEHRLRQSEEKLAQRLEPITMQEKLQEYRPKAIANRDAIGNRFWERMGDDFKDVLKEVEVDGKKQVQINGEALDELKKADPDRHAVVVNAAKAVETYAVAADLLDHNLARFDPRNEIHTNLRAFLDNREALMASKPPEKQMDKAGRRWLPREQYNALPDEQRARYWTFSHEDLGYMMAARIAKATTRFLADEEEKFARQAAAKGISVESIQRAVKSRRAAEDEEDNDNEPQPTRKPFSPSTSIQPRMSSAQVKIPKEPTGGLEGFISRAFNKR